jgi:hypothetical protein
VQRAFLFINEFGNNMYKKFNGKKMEGVLIVLLKRERDKRPM